MAIWMALNDRTGMLDQCCDTSNNSFARANHAAMLRRPLRRARACSPASAWSLRIFRPPPLRAIINMCKSISMNEVDTFLLLREPLNAACIHERQDLFARCLARIGSEDAACAPALDVSYHIRRFGVCCADQWNNFADHEPDKSPFAIAFHDVFSGHLFISYLIYLSMASTNILYLMFLYRSSFQRQANNSHNPWREQIETMTFALMGRAVCKSHVVQVHSLDKRRKSEYTSVQVVSLSGDARGRALIFEESGNICTTTPKR